MFSSFFSVLSVASSIGQAFMGYQQAAAMRAYYQSQADLTRLQYQQKKVAAKEEAVKALKATNRAIASTIAQAAAGGILSTEGSALLQQTVSLRGGMEDFQTALYNQQILQNFGTMEARSLQTAGSYQERFGLLGALTGLGTNLSQAYTQTATPYTPTIPNQFGTYTTQDLIDMDRGL